MGPGCRAGEEGKRWRGWSIAVFAPVRLDKDAVDLLEIDGAGLVADGFEEGTQTKIACAPEQAFAGADDERQGLGGEGVVAQADAVELGQDERLDGFGRQARQHDRVGDAGADFLVDGQGEGLQERGLPDQDQIVRMGRVFAKQTEFAQTLRGA